MNIIKKHILTEQEYLAGEQQSFNKHEFVGGKVFAMVGASAAHNFISGNLFAALKSYLKGKSWRPYINDMKVRVAGNYYYPDVVVDCSQIKADAYFVETPILIIEVLYSSTKQYDKTYKLQQYKKYSHIAGIRHD